MDPVRNIEICNKNPDTQNLGKITQIKISKTQTSPDLRYLSTMRRSSPDSPDLTFVLILSEDTLKCRHPQPLAAGEKTIFLKDGQFFSFRCTVKPIRLHSNTIKMKKYLTSWGHRQWIFEALKRVLWSNDTFSISSKDAAEDFIRYSLIFIHF